MKVFFLIAFSALFLASLPQPLRAQAICNKGTGACGGWNADYGVWCASWTRPCYNYAQTTTCADFPECGTDPDPDNNRIKWSRKRPAASKQILKEPNL